MINMDLINLSTIIQDLLLLLFIYIIIKAIAFIIITRFPGTHPKRSCVIGWGSLSYYIENRVQVKMVEEQNYYHNENYFKCYIYIWKTISSNKK